MKQPKFSIIIPTYNGSRTIERALQSVFMQVELDCEVLIVNDGSTDNTCELVEPFLKEFPSRLRYIKKINAGVGSARNLGIDKTSGEFLIFLDVDDQLEFNALALIRRHLAENTRTKFVVGKHRTLDELGNITLSKTTTFFSEKDQLFEHYLKKRISVVNGASVIHRDVFNSVRFSEQLDVNEDIPVFAIAFALYEASFIEGSLATIYKSSDSLRNTGYQLGSPKVLTGIIFDKDLLPAHLFALEKAYTARCFLSMVRSAYKKCNFKAARLFFHKAVLLDPSCLFKLSYLGKYLRSWRL